MSLDDIFRSCKVISVHTAKTPETHHMINERHFKLIGKDAIFINTSRGDVIDENALIKELKTGRFKALLDVYQREPLPANSEFATLDNVTVFPHQAGPTFDRRDRITNFLIDDIENYLNGKTMINEITKETAMRMTKA